MNNHTAMPTITFEPDTDYSMLDSIVSGWCARIWLSRGVILTAQWVRSDNNDNVNLLLWSNEEDGFVTPFTVAIDEITRISIL